jgi:hypothetical protein
VRKAAIPVLSGVLVFIAGLWFFRPAPSSSAAANAPAAPPKAAPASSSVSPPTATTPTLAPAPQSATAITPPALPLVATATTSPNPANPTTLSPAAVPSEPGLTRENFDRIQNGMTEREVTDILGPPKGSSTRTTTTNGHTTKKRVLAWRQYIAGQYKPYRTITVTFTNDQVSGKNWIQITPKQPKQP